MDPISLLSRRFSTMYREEWEKDLPKPEFLASIDQLIDGLTQTNVVLAEILRSNWSFRELPGVMNE